MKRKLIFLSVVCLFIFSCSVEKNKKNIHITEFQERFEFSKYILIDVRTKEEFSEGCIQGAINIDYLADNFIIKIQKLDLEIPVLLYCRSGNRSSKAMKTMKELGFKEVYNLEDGIKGWISENNPVITE
mgnify:CR=1 FL=1